MMATRTELDASLQKLIDERLDAIDRVLLQAGVSRGERRSIVEEVETQVHELLSRRAPAEPNRGDVLAVLASLDPPEAYAPEEYRHRLAAAPAKVPRPRLPQPSLLAFGAAAGGVFTLLAALVLLGLGADEEAALLLLVALLLPASVAVTTCGIVSIRRIRRSGGWQFGLPAALFAALLYPLLALNGLLVLALMVFQEIGLIVAVGLAFLTPNVYIVAHLWKWVSAGYSRAVPAPEGD